MLALTQKKNNRKIYVGFNIRIFRVELLDERLITGWTFDSRLKRM